MPLAATGLVLATPDAPLLAASACGLYAVVRALQSPAGSRRSLLWWCAAGLALGAAFASKYTSIFLPVCIVAAIVLRPSLRARLREAGPYVACVLATLVFVPVLRWNAAHDWISFRFQLSHGLGAPPRGSVLQRELDLVGGQLGLVSPILFVLMAQAVWRSIRRPVDDVHAALAVVAIGSWVFFVYSAMRRSVEANWPAPSYVPAVALLSSLVVRGLASARWTRYGVGLAGALVAIVYVHALHPVLPLPARRDPVARSAGWDGVASQAERARHTITHRTAWLGADRYQDVSELAYHAPRDAEAFCICLTGRHNQYELWPSFAQSARPGDALVLVLDDSPGMHDDAARLAPYFTRVTRGELAPLLRGADTVSVRRVYVLEGYRGGWPSRAER
jgi:4-amino-4-deoxy-L-arabinose transferase-like glycosyltransferase